MEYGGGSRFQRAMANFRANKLQLLCTAAYCFTFLGLGISMTGIGPTLLELADLTHSSIKGMGYIISIKGVGYLLGSMSGRLYDKYDGHKLQFGSTLITASLVFLVPFIKTIWGQGLVWFGVGLFTGCIDTGANTLTVWTWNEKVAPYMQLLHFSFGVGAFLSPVVLSMLQKEALYKQYMALAIPLAAAAFPVIFFKSPTNTNAIKEVELTIADSPKETLILNNSDSSSIMEETTQDDTDSLSVSDDLKQSSEVSISSGSIEYNHNNTNYNVKRLRVEAIFFSAVMLFLDVGAEIGFGGYIFTYANKQLGFSDKDSAYLNAAFWGTFTIGRLAAVGISFYLTPKAMLFLDAIGSVISMAILIVFPKSEIAIWVCTVGYGLSIASVYPTAISLPQTLGVELTGADTSWLVIGGSAGEVIIPLLIGVLQEHFSLYVMVFVMLIVVTMGGVTLCVLLLRVKFLKGESSSIFSNLLKNRNVVAFSELSEESSADLVI